MTVERMPTVIICPGNGCTNIQRSNWYGSFHKEFTDAGIRSICQNFPDPNQARRSIWIPHIRALAEKACPDDPSNIILVGHSSGAQATLRYAEQYPIRAAVLVAATYSDLGDASERASGYYPQTTTDAEGDSDVVVTNPYEFPKVKEHCPVWYQFHSDNDPFIPLREAEQIRTGLGLTAAGAEKDDNGHYRMLPGRSHFFESFPELLQVVLSLCESD